ncbi:mitoguardin 1 isoform X1 [Sphaerodactylus townsendi]|uniref:mitoguardin 1 isoform X1 n=2 Tax=Sphaerodactylus townsendi TaxID=933632 RepID=UPI002025F390|nr:mitoguardin 1 isoform X1 [Sphaerodactylus townsendi]XP_048352821.1 mitoguardin 1 isoform X1 [Sphaerodactylus townsendi]XP_048352822.1 mitoguardin 1 isoform X1 [Sphaerodactylus townsendi]XP_048352823.1 mitoguardin 1 isoform X1 [Sphaerodactylus townsendi]XP_048352824.1 mitoguardin 1 isoform X1 [Sphaerodactylus townsendi]
MSENAFGDTHIFLKTAALRVFNLPLAWYSSLIQVKISPGLKKLIAVTTVSAISVLFLAHHFKRKRGKKNRTIPPWEPGHMILEYTRTALSEKDSSCSSSRQNLTLSLSSAKDKGSQSYINANGSFFSKHSGSVQSLASVQSATSCPSCVCVNSNSWDKTNEDDMKLVNIPVTTPENLYLMGMELFEEALRRWEQALAFRNRHVEDEANCSSIKLGAGDAIAEESVDDIISAEFIHKLESLLQRAYRLQEEFETSLGASDPASFANDVDKDTDITVKDNTDEFSLRDTLSIASTDSFVSAAELAEHREGRNIYHLDSLCHCPLYEEAVQLAEEGKIYSRVLRTEMLECLGDSDFLAKLHCIRQAFQVILSDTANRLFLAESGRKILSALTVKAKKNPKKFEEVFDEMISFLEQADHWSNTEMELAAWGVKHLNFYDVVLDFIFMDSFEDLENPPMSIQNVVNNHWLNSSFKETAVASSCWSVLKQKKQQMKVHDGFFAHFYGICEHISPVLAWGFLGPRNSLYEFCRFFKDQVLYFLKDIFDFEKVRYSTVESLAEDLMQLLIHHTDLLLIYLEAESLRHVSGCVNEHGQTTTSNLLDAKVL